MVIGVLAVMMVACVLFYFGWGGGWDFGDTLATRADLVAIMVVWQ